ncbi:MAG: hypothetical protein IPH44_07165 [Myxococcales bacterium]|nr:hypothetical protein [Myxococcales bacterium]
MARAPTARPSAAIATAVPRSLSMLTTSAHAVGAARPSSWLATATTRGQASARPAASISVWYAHAR